MWGVFGPHGDVMSQNKLQCVCVCVHGDEGMSPSVTVWLTDQQLTKIATATRPVCIHAMTMFFK